MSSGFPTRSDTNQAVQTQKMARGLKFWISEVEGLYYPCSENKDADQLRLCFHMPKTGFLMTRFIYGGYFVIIIRYFAYRSI